MDYTNVCQGWIYYIKNKVNGHMYIGQSKQYETRIWRHFYGAENCPILQRAIKKYGKESFEVGVIVTFTAVNDDVRKSILNWLERYYIQKFDTYNNGYNATLGGEGRHGVIVSKETGAKISAANTGRKYSDEVKERDSVSSTKRIDFNKQFILMYDLQGNFVKKFYSYYQISKYLGVKNSNMSNLIYRCTQIENTCTYGYMWRLTDFEFFPLSIKPYVDRKYRRVYYYTKNDEFIASYPSITDAAKEVGCTNHCIVSSLNSKRPTHYTNYWSYQAPTA